MQKPTVDEIQRVAEYWQWVKDMNCQHEEIMFTSGEAALCGKCERPIIILSDVQLEARVNKEEVKSE